MPGLAVRAVGSGPPLVMLPGWGMHSGMWGEFAQALARHFTLVRVDLPGHGAAPSRRSWELTDLIGELARLEREAFWLGWSLGGQLLMALADRRPERVRGLALLAANPRFVAAAGWPGMDPRLFDAFRRQLREDPSSTLRRFLGLIAQGAPRSVARKVRQQWRSAPPPAPADLCRGLDLLARLDLRSRLASIRCPVVIVGGERDALVPPEALRRAAAFFPEAHLVMVGAGGHVPFLVEPDSLAERIRTAFL